MSAGLTVRSDFDLPELIACESAAERADIAITRGTVPESLGDSEQPLQEAEVNPEEVLITIPGVARYLVSSGTRILVEAVSAARERDIRLFLLGSALGAVYFQRGHLPLHASVVIIDGAAVAFAGDSGAGKSTLATWLNRHGHPLLCDDVCVIRFDSGSEPLAYPGFPRLKLWDDALEALDIENRDLQRDYLRADKFHLNVPENFWMDPVPLRQIYILEFSEDGGPAETEPISPARAVPLLRNNTYRCQYISGLGLVRQHFLDCVRLAEKVPVKILRRPRDHALMEECGQLIEKEAR